MEAKVSEILENILGMLGLEGSFEVAEETDEVKVSIDTEEPGRLIGYKGETLDSLQLLINQMVGRDSTTPFKRVIIDVGGWRKKKEEELTGRAKDWVKEALDKGEPLHLEPMPSWQRRIIHLAVSQITEVSSESIGEGRERHLVITPVSTQEKPVTDETKSAEVVKKPKTKKKEIKKEKK